MTWVTLDLHWLKCNRLLKDMWEKISRLETLAAMFSRQIFCLFLVFLSLSNFRKVRNLAWERERIYSVSLNDAEWFFSTFWALSRSQFTVEWSIKFLFSFLIVWRESKEFLVSLKIMVFWKNSKSIVF